MGLEVVGDMAGMWKESTSALASGISGLGASETADQLSKLTSALDILAGSMQIAGTVATILSSLNSVSSAEAAAETAVNAALGPIGWGKIALAVAAMGTVSALTYSIMAYTLRADLSTPSGTQAVTQSLGVIM